MNTNDSNTNDNNQSERRLSRDELSSAYDELLRNFSDEESPSKKRQMSDAPAVQRVPRRDSTVHAAGETEAAQPRSSTPPATKTVTAEEKKASSSNSKKKTRKPAEKDSAPRKKTSTQKKAAPARPLTAKEKAKLKKRKQRERYKEQKRQFRKQRMAHSLLSLLVSIMLIVIIFLTSSALKVPLLGFINDIIAIDRNDAPVAVYISEDMKTDQILDMLEEQDLIYSAKFCSLLMGFFGYTDDTQYIVGEHVLTAKQGVEGMLNSMIAETDAYATVKITFPEGYTIDQIAEKLYSEKVISSKNIFYNAIATYEFGDDYDFLNSVTDVEKRYRILEGFMYPDTYEFYIGENINSVLNRFLSNFSSKWTADYQNEASALGYSVDEIITIASILQKEAKDANQMYIISSILHNRLKSDSLTILQCDSTQDYIAKLDAGLLSQTELNALLAVYDTYQCAGLPVGPICNPGSDAIYAALHPDATDYYYFCHDSDGNIYLAKTLDEHSVNVQTYVK